MVKHFLHRDGIVCHFIVAGVFLQSSTTQLTVQLQKSSKNKPVLNPLNTSDLSKVPYVTIQLPVFNELYVMERLLKCINKIEYPRERLEIQVLDDSNDESVALTKGIVESLQKEGLDIVQIRRKIAQDLKQVH